MPEKSLFQLLSARGRVCVRPRGASLCVSSSLHTTADGFSITEQFSWCFCGVFRRWFVHTLKNVTFYHWKCIQAMNIFTKLTLKHFYVRGKCMDVTLLMPCGSQQTTVESDLITPIYLVAKHLKKKMKTNYFLRQFLISLSINVHFIFGLSLPFCKKSNDINKIRSA